MARMEDFKPHIPQILVRASIAGMNIIARVALDKGMNHLVFVAHRQAVAIIIMGPLAYFLERNERPAMTCAIFWQIFLLSLCGVAFNQNFYFTGLGYTSSTFASATSNLIPVVTIMMATAFGLEKFELRTKRGLAKIIIIILSVGGAMIMTLYKGPTLHLLKNNNTWILGALMLFGSTICWSIYIIFQTPVLKKYPVKKSFTAMALLLGTVQSTVMGLIFEPKVSAWKLKWDMELLSIVYSGVLCSAFGSFITTYCVHEKGAVFSTLFNPLSTILVAILELLILYVNLDLGSVVGGVLIFAGLYTVLWGKAKDQKHTGPTADGIRNGSNTDEIHQSLLENETYDQHQSHSEAKFLTVAYAPRIEP